MEANDKLPISSNEALNSTVLLKLAEMLEDPEQSEAAVRMLVFDTSLLAKILKVAACDPEQSLPQLIEENEQLKAEIEGLKNDKYIDTKTGIASYDAFKDFILPEIQLYIETKDTDLRASRPELIFGIGDINAMNLINEWVTHTGGDRVIADVAQALKACVRDIDWVGRFGGAADEFCILLRVAPTENSEDVLNIINARIDEYVARTVGVPYPVSISFGFVPVADYTSAQEAVIAADAEMYQKKDAWKKAMRAAGFAISHRLQED